MSLSISGPRRTASQSKLGRMFQCMGGNQSFAAPTPESTAKDTSHCLMVFCAGSDNFNGMYTMGTVASKITFATRKTVFHKVGSSETLVFYNGWWLFNDGGSGDSHYGARAENAEQQGTPPEVGWHMKHGQSPPPRVQCFNNSEEVPRQLRDPGMLERSVLDVCCAGSADFNGSYIPCGISQGKFCYHKVGGVQMIVFHKGWWLINENGNGESFYGCRAPEGDHVAPAEADWFHKVGQAPAPRVQCRASQSKLTGLAPVEEEPESGLFHIDCCYRVEASWQHYCFSTAGDVDHNCPAAELGSEVEGERIDGGWVKVHMAGRGMRFLPIELDGHVVMRDVDELSEISPGSASLSEENVQRAAHEHTACSVWIEPGKAEECSVASTDDAVADSVESLSKDVSTPSGSLEAELVRDSTLSASLSEENVQRAAREHTACSVWIEPGKAEECSVASTDDAVADSVESLSKDVSTPSGSLEAELVRDSTGSSSLVFLGVEPDTESIGQDGIVSVRLEEVHAEDECAGQLATAASSRREWTLAEHVDSQRPPQPQCGVLSIISNSDDIKEQASTDASSGQEAICAEHVDAQTPPLPHCGVQDTMPDSDEVKELRMPTKECDSFRSEAEEMPCAGFVSQRVSVFTKLSSSRSQSLSGLTDAPDRGLVSERIRAHQRFISGATQEQLRCQ